MAKNEKTQKTGRFAGIIAELKQVSWPSFSDTIKKLGAVLLITGIFLVAFMGVDALLKWMYSCLTMGVVGTWNPAQGINGYFSYTDSYNNVQSMYVGEMIAAAAIAAALVIGAIVAIIIIKGRKKENF